MLRSQSGDLTGYPLATLACSWIASGAITRTMHTLSQVGCCADQQIPPASQDFAAVLLAQLRSPWNLGIHWRASGAAVRCYSVSAGDIWEGLYADDCFFGDPTVSFTGQLH